jgi:formylmethanofuran dehydrogenase subunit B
MFKMLKSVFMASRKNPPVFTEEHRREIINIIVQAKRDGAFGSSSVSMEGIVNAFELAEKNGGFSTASDAVFNAIK